MSSRPVFGSLRPVFGGSFTRWLICKRDGRWHVIPPFGYLTPRAEFATGAEAFTAFASGRRDA